MGCLSDFGINFGNNNQNSNLNRYEAQKQHANQIVEKLRPKINEYILKRDSQTPRVIAKGNYCNNPCYEFNLNLFKTCPKCKGAVVEDYENEYTIKNVLNNNQLFEKKYYKKDTCCTDFVFDEKLISKEDCYGGVLISFFERQEEVDGKKNYYMMLDGEKYDFGDISLVTFFAGQGKALFPEKNGVEEVLIIYKVGDPVTYSNLQNGRRVPLVCLYRCGKCGLKYHIMQTSPFMFRDKSKDVPK